MPDGSEFRFLEPSIDDDLEPVAAVQAVRIELVVSV
jgi:hypothetical protein